MRSGRVLRVVVCGLLLAACATQRVWTKPDFNEQAWVLDRDACVEESRTEVKIPTFYWVFASVVMPIGLPAMVLGFRRDAQKFADEKMKACLTSRGYQQMLAPLPPPNRTPRLAVPPPARARTSRSSQDAVPSPSAQAQVPRAVPRPGWGGRGDPGPEGARVLSPGDVSPRQGSPSGTPAPSFCRRAAKFCDSMGAGALGGRGGEAAGRLEPVTPEHGGLRWTSIGCG